MCHNIVIEQWQISSFGSSGLTKSQTPKSMELHSSWASDDGTFRKRFARTFFTFFSVFYYPHKWRMITSLAQFYSFVLSQFPCSVCSQTLGPLHTVPFYYSTSALCVLNLKVSVCVTACHNSSQSENGKSFLIGHFVSNPIAIGIIGY